MWELDCEEGWVLKNWWFWTVVLQKTLESPLDYKEIQHHSSKASILWCSAFFIVQLSHLYMNTGKIIAWLNGSLLAKVHLVKAMFFPVVMYRCESWTVKKVECRRIDAFELWCWRRLLRVPWTARRSNTTVQKHQFFGTQPSSQSNSHTHTWPQEKP